jgi:hypothetical protein
LVVGFIKHSIEKHKAEKDRPGKNQRSNQNPRAGKPSGNP